MNSVCGVYLVLYSNWWHKHSVLVCLGGGVAPPPGMESHREQPTSTRDLLYPAESTPTDCASSTSTDQ
jgi:hypothetical protein